MVKVSLFLSSFSPLFALLALRLKPLQLWLPLAVLALLGLLALFSLLKQRGRLEPNPRGFTNVRDEGAQIAGYLASYILPLLVLDEPKWQDAVAYLGFLVLYAIVFINSDLLQVNPLLYLAGYRVFAAEDSTRGETFYLLAARKDGRPRSGDLRVSDIAPHFLLVHPENQ